VQLAERFLHLSTELEVVRNAMRLALANGGARAATGAVETPSAAGRKEAASEAPEALHETSLGYAEARLCVQDDEGRKSQRGEFGSLSLGSGKRFVSPSAWLTQPDAALG
jgi:hypothetical protein